MAITHTKLEIMNTALRMVGSYHLESDDTTSTTYEIANRAFEDAVNTVFSENIFTYNTRRVFSDTNVVDTTTLTFDNKPSDYWAYRHPLNDQAINADGSAPAVGNKQHSMNTIIKVTNETGDILLDWVLDQSSDTHDSGRTEVPYLFTTEEKVHYYFSFVPDLNAPLTSDYRAQGEVAARMPAFLVRIVALNMASSMCVELSGDDTRAGTLYDQYILAIRRARVMEGRQSPAQQYITDSTSSIISAHNNYGKIY